jgi:hypothetical protein
LACPLTEAGTLAGGPDRPRAAPLPRLRVAGAAARELRGGVEADFPGLGPDAADGLPPPFEAGLLDGALRFAAPLPGVESRTARVPGLPDCGVLRGAGDV